MFSVCSHLGGVSQPGQGTVARSRWGGGTLAKSGWGGVPNRGWGTPNPEMGYLPHQDGVPPTIQGWGTSQSGWGTPSLGYRPRHRTTDGVLDMRRTECLLRSRKKTFLFGNNIVYSHRDDKKIVCLTQPLDDNQQINTVQSVVVTWATGEKDTRFRFTYKPNPVINGIQPNTTTLRYEVLHLILLYLYECGSFPRQIKDPFYLRKAYFGLSETIIVTI